MNYERERCLAEQHAMSALASENWRMAAHNLFNASRMTLGMARGSAGRTRDSLFRLAKQYEVRGDQALTKHKTAQDSPKQRETGQNQP